MEKRMQDKKLPGNLVALIYAQNSCYTTVTSDCPEGLDISMKPGKIATWSYKNPNDKSAWTPTPRKIGECDYRMRTESCGVIGVYERMKDEHLNNMLRASREMTDRGRESFDD